MLLSSQFNTRAVRTADSTQCRFSLYFGNEYKFFIQFQESPQNNDENQITGNVPGVAASKSETAVFAGDVGSFGAAENNLLFDKICACTSRPTTL